MEKSETVVLTCKGEDSGVLESAILQLGYTIIDSCWEDETNIMTYVVKKKWLKAFD